MISKIISSHRKKKENISVRPKSYVARKLGAATFWVLFFFMFLVVTLTMISNASKADEKGSVQVEERVNESTKPEAIQFAESFIEQYFTWSTDTEVKNKRSEKLNQFLAKGLDIHGGLEIDSVTWNSRYIGSKVKKVEEMGGNQAFITFYVDIELSKAIKQETKVEDKEKVEEAKTEILTKNIGKYFVVPVAYDGKTYGVYELPKFTFIDEQTTLVAEKPAGLKTLNDSKEAQNIREFLNTFFVSFAEDSEDKLVYILEDPNYKNGLNQTMEFVEVTNSEVYEGGKENQFSVTCDVILSDPESEVQFKTNYKLTIRKDGDRFIVSSLDKLKKLTKEE